MKEKGFELQIFQNALSAMSMYPLRLYKNDCYASFEKLLSDHPDVKEKLIALLGDDVHEDDAFISLLQQKLKENPRRYYKPLTAILEPLSEAMLEILWATKPSNSLVFTREVKSSKTLWLLLMFYDFLPESFIAERFKTPYLRRCLIDMQTVCVRLNDACSITIGRFFDEGQDVSGIIRMIVEGYEIHNSDIFELTKLAHVRNFFAADDVLKDAFHIKQAYSRFWSLLDQLPPAISKEALEKIAVFIYMSVRKGLTEGYLVLEKETLCLHEEMLFFRRTETSQCEQMALFEEHYKRYRQFRNFFQNEYTSSLKSTLAKKYAGFEEGEDVFSPVNEVIKRISSTLYADGACYIKYHFSKQIFRMVAVYGDDAYKEGINSFIQKINQDDARAVRKNRVMKIVNSYFSEQNHNNISRLALLNLKEDEILQPISGKTIRSNIAIPITFKHKLLGILLIDSYRPNAFMQSDIQQVLSISNEFSIHIYDEIVEKNLFNIIRNVPSQTQLSDEKSIDAVSANLTHYINNIFLSLGVDIWSYENEKFRRISSTIQSDLIGREIVCKDEPEFICRLTTGETDCLTEEDIRNSKAFTLCKPLADSRINAVKIYGIYHEDGTLAGALSVYNRSLADYMSIDVRSLQSVRDYLRIFFSIVDTFRTSKKIVHNHALHDINQYILMIDEKSRQLKELLFFHFKELDRYSRYRFGIKLKDINYITRNLKSKFYYIAGRGTSFANSNDIDLQIEDQYREMQKTFNGETYLPGLLYRIVNSVYYTHKKLRFKIDIDELYLRVAPEILEDIFINLVQNAVKYSYQDSYISIHTVKLKHTLQIRVENIGIGIIADEFDDIFEYKYRGFNALEFEEEIGDEVVRYPRGEKENDGYGLYKCKKLVKLLGGGIRLEDSTETSRGYKNTFLISIPMVLVNQKKVL